MDQSRRAVESYWRSRMVDGVTAEDDKVAPVYKLEEICELLRASDASIVKEIAEFVLKRLDNKSPLVKQKVGRPLPLLPFFPLLLVWDRVDLSGMRIGWAVANDDRRVFTVSVVLYSDENMVSIVAAAVTAVVFPPG
jgi:hypothetical protein